jgi:hypothetical protein
MLLRIMLALSVIALVGGCETIRYNNIGTELQQKSKSYNLLLRWNELDKAIALFPPERLREEFRRKVKAAKGVTVTDVRVKSQSCSPKRGEAMVVVDVDYYREPSVTVRTVEDVQSWLYLEEEKDAWIWRLMSLPPDFK